MAAEPLVVQVTRGLAPALAIASCVLGAVEHGWPYEQLSGLGLADALTLALERASRLERDLLLVEDDIIVPWSDWPRGRPGIVEAVEALCPQTGQSNVTRRRDGGVVWVGTCMMRLPWAVCGAVGRIFAMRLRWDPVAEVLMPGPAAPDGSGTDVYLCHRLGELGVPIEIVAGGIIIDHSLRGFPASRMRALG